MAAAELRKTIPHESLPTSDEDGEVGRNESGDTVKESKSIHLPTGQDIKNLTEEEITERIENILLDRIKQGNNQALFQLGQLYYEQVSKWVNMWVSIWVSMSNSI